MKYLYFTGEGVEAEALIAEAMKLKLKMERETDLVEDRRVSDHITRKLGLSQCVSGPHSATCTGRGLYFTAAKVVGGKIFVKIPVISGSCNLGDTQPRVPSWLKEVEKPVWWLAQDI